MSVGLFAPGLDIITGGVAADVKAIDPELVVVLNRRAVRNSLGQYEPRYEIYDRAAPGGPKWSLVLRCQEPDGSFRPLDGRVLPTLREARGRDVQAFIKGIEQQEDEVEKRAERRARDLGEQLYDATWAMGRRVMGYGGNTVTWQQRTDPTARERIRVAAGL